LGELESKAEDQRFYQGQVKAFRKALGLMDEIVEGLQGDIADSAIKE
jgi:hypothetical protein